MIFNKGLKMSITAASKARENMVVSQLQPAGITDEKIIEAYRETAREDFLPASLKTVCYLDESLDLGDGYVLLEPLLHGLLVSELKVQNGEKCLDLGDPTGYSAAVLSYLGAAVSREIPVETNRFDAILINGAVAEIDNRLISQLDTGGRIACILQPDANNVGKIVVLTKERNGTMSKQTFEDAKAAYVPGYEPRPEFVF